MAFTTAQLTALEEALASGQVEVTYDGKTVKYRNIDDLRKAYEFVRGQLIEAGSVNDSRKRLSITSFSKD